MTGLRRAALSTITTGFRHARWPGLRAAAVGVGVLVTLLGGCNRSSSTKYDLMMNENQELQRKVAALDAAKRAVDDENAQLRTQNDQLAGALDEATRQINTGAATLSTASTPTANQLLADEFRDVGDGISVGTRSGDIVIAVAGDVLFASGKVTLRDTAKRSLERVTARVDAGDLRPFERDIAENGLRQAESSLASLEEQYTLALQRFLVRLGLDPTAAARIEPFELALPEAQITPQAVAELALSYRLDLQNRRDQLDDARRAVANARNNVLADLNLSGSVTVPTDSDDSEIGRASCRERV